ncbi:MAG: pyrimidine dimer DNA glycosylase/endonuclease V [Anaerolineae bacterium]
MRLWSLHPRYLDGMRLVAAWREGLLAQKVLQGGTRGYRNHPQLNRFRQQPEPLPAIGAFLYYLYEEGQRRRYRLNLQKILVYNLSLVMTVTDGQLRYEWRHLQRKLGGQDESWSETWPETIPEPNPLFRVIVGDIEPFEKVK